jgi:hypothetical protein
VFRQDYIKRLIDQLADFVARVSRLMAEGRLPEADAELVQAEQQLGLPLGSERLDARSLALLLGDGDRVVLLAILLEQKALLAERRGDSSQASRELSRAKQLLLHAKPQALAAQAAELSLRLSTRR